MKARTLSHNYLLPCFANNPLYWILSFLMCFVSFGCSQSIFVPQDNEKIDNEPPVYVSFPNDIIDTCRMVFDYGKPVVSDNSGEVHLAFIDETKGNCMDGMLVKRTWSAIDRSGNQATRVQQIKLIGNGKTTETEFEPPVLDDKLYLIPNSDFTLLKLKFRIENDDIVKANIYDLQGNAMLSVEEDLSVGQVLKEIDISNYENGTYIVMVQHNGKYLSRQFIKE